MIRRRYAGAQCSNDWSVFRDGALISHSYNTTTKHTKLVGIKISVQFLARAAYGIIIVVIVDVIVLSLVYIKADCEECLVQKRPLGHVKLFVKMFVKVSTWTDTDRRSYHKPGG